MSVCGDGSSPLCTCFNNVPGIKFMYYGQYTDLATGWETFRRIELYNSNVSTLRGQGNTDLNYYQFVTNQEQSYYRQGGVLFFTYLNYSTIVEKN